MNKVTAFLILLIGLLQYKLWFGDGNVLEFQRMNDRIAELRQEGARRRERNAALEAEVMDLKQGLDAVEERARHELGMIMDGEEFVQVIDPQQEPELSITSPPVKSTVTDALPDAAKRSKSEKYAKNKKPKEADTSKPNKSKPDTTKIKESKPALAKKSAAETNATPKAQAEPVKPAKPKPVTKTQPKKAEQPARELQPLFDEDNH